MGECHCPCYTDGEIEAKRVCGDRIKLHGESLAGPGKEL